MDLQNGPKPIDLSIRGRVVLEEVVRDKRHTTLFQRGRVLFGPDLVLRDLKSWCPILDDEL